MNVKVVLCDIEGTTTSITFAHQVLFPLSYERIEEFLRIHAESLHGEILLVKRQIGRPPEQINLEEVIDTLKTWIKTDKKETALKSIQGKIWKEAFESGQIKGHVYPDVPEQLKSWTQQGIKIAIFSSGSVEAQKLIYRYSEVGDLTPFIWAYFDTSTGPKKDAGSYRLIAQELGVSASEILFLSDVVAELDAARSAGMKTVLIVREDTAPPTVNAHQTATNFREIFLADYK